MCGMPGSVWIGLPFPQRRVDSTSFTFILQAATNDRFRMPSFPMNLFVDLQRQNKGGLPSIVMLACYARNSGHLPILHATSTGEYDTAVHVCYHVPKQ